MSDDVRSTAGTARGVPILTVPGVRKDEFDRWVRENPDAFRTILGMPLSQDALFTQLSEAIKKARAGWPQPRPALPSKPTPREPDVLGPPHEVEPGRVPILAPDGWLYIVSEDTAEWLEAERRSAVAWEYIQTAAAALAGMPQRPTPTPPPPPPPTGVVTKVERGLAKPRPARPSAPSASPASPARTPPGAPRQAEPAIPIPRGMSRNAMLEPASRDAKYPTADLVNVNQPALDLIDGKRAVTVDQRTLKKGDVQVDRSTVGGRWIQLKRLEPEGGTVRTPLEQRLRNELDTALRKYDKVLDNRSPVSRSTNTLSDGTRLTESFSQPDSLHVSLEVEGLAPERVDGLQRLAESYLRSGTQLWGHQPNRIVGVPVTVSVSRAP